MCGRVSLGDAWCKRLLALPPRSIDLSGAERLARLRQNELRLPRANQIDIDFREQFRVEQSAVFGSAGIIDGVARAQIVEPVRHTGMLAPGQRQRIDQTVARDSRSLDLGKFGIDEADIE